MPVRLLTQSLILKHRQARLQKEQNGGVKWVQRIGLVLIILMSLGAVIAGITVSRNYASLTSDLPPVGMLPILMNPETGQLLQPTRFYDRSGTNLFYTLENASVSRRFLSLDPAVDASFSPWLTQAVIGYYQPDYWKSSSTSLFLNGNSEPQTIAERLVSDLLFWKEEAGPRKTFRVRILADQAVQQYGKTAVLEWFINSLNFGHKAWSAESAAQLYLGKSAHDLNLAEAAYLIGIAQTPALNPIDVPANAEKFTKPVLDELLSNKAISQDDYQKALAVKIDPRIPTPVKHDSSEAIVNIILAQLADEFPQLRLERGGLNVVTTLDFDLQQQTECALQLQLARLQLKSYNAVLPGGQTCSAASTLPTYIGLQQPLPEDLTGSVLVIDPQSGEVLAMAGDSQLGSQGDMLHAHEPGSLLTPFVAVAGFARGLSPATLEWDIPARLPDAVANYYSTGADFQGPMRLRTALNRDILNPFAQLLNQMGAADVWRYIEPFGLNGLTNLENPVSLIYKGGSISPLKLAQAYSIFANQGMLSGWDATGNGDLSPVTVKAITDPIGNLVWQGMKSELKTVLSAPLAYLVHEVLSESSSQSIALASRNPLDIGSPSASKTGKLADGSQVWTVGYTPQRLSVIWLGSSSTGTQKMDAQMAAGLWHAVMIQAQQYVPVENWSMPAEIVKKHVCDPSGLLATIYCPNVVEELFLNGEEPLAYDNLYQPFEIDRDTGKLATVFTPLNRVDSRVYIVVPDDAKSWALSAGLPIPPTDYDTVQLAPRNPQVVITSPQNFVFIHGQVKIQGTAESDQFKEYRVEVGQGINPQDWLLVSSDGSKAVQDSVLANWDTSGLNGLYTIRLIVVHTDQTFESDVVQVTVDNTPPVVSVDYPRDQQQITSSGPILLLVTASDEIGVARVEWWLDDTLVGEVNSTPFVLNWQTVSGKHTLFARAFDLAGNMSQSDTLSFEVLP